MSDLTFFFVFSRLSIMSLHYFYNPQKDFPTEMELLVQIIKI